MIVAPVFRHFYHPKVIGAERIPENGKIILAGNHKHALDPILVDICTKRTVHALAKSELFKGPFGPFFKAIGAISVDLDANKNPEAYERAKVILRNGGVINIHFVRIPFVFEENSDKTYKMLRDVIRKCFKLE